MSFRAAKWKRQKTKQGEKVWESAAELGFLHAVTPWPHQLTLRLCTADDPWKRYHSGRDEFILTKAAGRPATGWFSSEGA